MAIRNYGLSGSGLDIEQMVKGLMEAKRVRYDKLYQQKTRLEYKKSDYNKMYTALTEFRDNAVMDFRLSQQLNPKQAKIANSSIATVTANAGTALVNHSLEVVSLATQASLRNTGSISTGAKTTLKDQFGISDPTPFDITLSDGVKTAIITVDPANSINDFAASINNAGLNIRATYDATLDQFTMYNIKGGSANKVEVTADANVTLDPGPPAVTANFMQNVLGLGSLSAVGTDAIIKLDQITVTKDSNEFTVSGMNFELKQLGTTTIDVKSDVDQAIANAKAFVETYNALRKTINDELEEKYYSDYDPLTTEQKKEYGEAELAFWDERAKSGMLRSDATLRSLLNDLTMDFGSAQPGLTGKYRSAMDIGISTGSYIDESGNYVNLGVKSGDIYVDEDKLRKALSEDPDILQKIFAPTDAAENGISRQLSNTLKRGIEKVTDLAGRTADLTSDADSNLARRISALEKQMTREKTRLEALEQRYYKQFDALEVMLNRLATQNSWLLEQGS